jgi:hypothetical protein
MTDRDKAFETACGIVMEAKSLKSVLRHTDVVDAIAGALRAEREACAKIAEEQFGDNLIAGAIRAG